MPTTEEIVSMAQIDPVLDRSPEPAFMTSVRMRAQRRLLWLRSSSASGDERLEILGNELCDPAEAAMREAEFYQTDPAAKYLSGRIEAAGLEWSQDAAWKRLRQMFSLCDVEVALLALAAAGDIAPELLRAYACFHDDPQARYASQWLASQLFPEMEPARLGPQCALLQWRLARVPETAVNSWAAHAPWLADSQIMLWLAGEPAQDAVLASAVELIPKTVGSTQTCLFPELLQEMLDFLKAASNPDAGPNRGAREMAAVEIELSGPTGSGKRMLGAQFAAALGADLLVVDADQLLAETSPAAATERLVRAVRMARLSEAILYWENGDALSRRVWQAIGGYGGVMMFGSPAPSSRTSKSPATRRAFELPALRRETRLALWRQLTGQEAPAIIENQVLSPAEIARAANMVSGGPEAIAHVCQESLSSVPGELFTQLTCPFTWADIVLPPALRSHLAELEAQVRLRWAVYEDWGFERLCPMGGGITAMFCGPSGTGKTMAAQVLARSLGLRLLRVDLAGVVNKYIGETEKRLKQVFDVCERSSVMLFFDEADALFGHRTQVKDAQDRFANIEVDYLLQRMEQFQGVAILATNRKGDLDKAFVRRLRFILDFYPPGPAERKALWQRALSARSPSGEEILEPIDWDLLANKLNMTGADIASSALAAAFLARREGRRIDMEHVLRASRRELAKHGNVVRPGEWEGTN